MRLFFVAKQFTMRRDFVADRYWRLWHLPAELARRGHAVSGLACSYRAVHAPDSRDLGGMHWHTQHLSPVDPRSLWRWARALEATAREHRSELIVASSDALQLEAGRRLARRLDVPLVVDFYDNYESYGASCVPGVKGRLSAAATAAAGVSFVSAPLRRHLQARYRLAMPTLVLENAVDPAFLNPPDRVAARRRLGLPEQARLIGTAGALDSSRNIEALYGAFLGLAREDHALHLVLAGDPRVPPPAHDRLHLLRTLPPEQMPGFWAALDVASIGLQDDTFGRYCYPQKLAEAAATGTPLVFPRIGVFAEPQAERLGECAPSNDAAGLAAALREQLERPRPPGWRPRTWAEASGAFEAFIAPLA